VEILELELGDFSRRIGSVVVSHHATTLTRGLEYGESVLVHDSGRSTFLARVADISFGYTDTYYRLELGSPSPIPLEVGDIVSMLRDLPRAAQPHLHSA